jgi:Zn-dependent protease with chaperone function
MPTKILICFAIGLIICANSGIAAEKDFWPARDDKEITRALETALHGEFTFVTDTPIMSSLERLAAKVAPDVCGTQERCKVMILNDSRPIVMASRGFVCLSSALLDMCADPPEVAAAMAHGLAHVRLGHLIAFYRDFEKDFREQRSEGQKFRTAGKWLFFTTLPGALLKDLGNKYEIKENFPNADVFSRTAPVLERAIRGLPSRAFGFGFQAFIFIDPMLFALNREAYVGYEAEAELKADETALDLLREAGLPPQAYISLLKKLSENCPVWNQRGIGSHLLDAAPKLEERIKHVTDLLDKTH